MDLEKLALGTVWWDETERVHAECLASELMAAAAESGDARTPLTALRAREVVVMYVLVLRAEEALREAGGEVQNPSGGAKGRRDDAAAEGVGRAYERLRKAMREFEEMCLPWARATDRGIADVMRAVFKKADGALHEALAGPARKRSRKPKARSRTPEHAAGK